MKNLFFKASITSTNGGSVKNKYNLPSISPLFGHIALKLVSSDIKIQLSYKFSDSKNPSDYSNGGEDGLEETPLIGIDDKENEIYNGMPSWGVLKFSSSYQISNRTKASLIFETLTQIKIMFIKKGNMM